MYSCSVVICIQHTSFCSSCSSAVFLHFYFFFFLPPYSPPGVQFPASAKWPCSHSQRYESGDKNTMHHSRHEAEIWYAERVLLHQEFTCPQHNKRRDWPNNNFSLQGVWQVSEYGWLQYYITFACLYSRWIVLWQTLYFALMVSKEQFALRWHVPLPKPSEDGLHDVLGASPAVFTPIFLNPFTCCNFHMWQSSFLLHHRIACDSAQLSLWFCAWVCPS